jgi:LuxR family maltose regulon positive regulatory protein
VFLDQWAERDERPVAKVDLSRPEGDSVRVVDRVAHALAEVGVLTSQANQYEAPTASGGRRRSVTDLVLGLDDTPSVLMIDHAEALDSHRARDVVAELVARLPDSMTTAIGCRSIPFEGFGVYRASPSTLEITTEDLAMTEDETRALAEEFCVDCAADQIAAIHTRTEGWPAGAYLSLLAAMSGRWGDAVPLIGADEHGIAQYIREELLQGLSPSRRTFAMKTAVLDELSAPACDYLLDRTRSQQTLEALADSNMLVTPTDPQHHTYRYHDLLRQVLLADLRERDGAAELELQRRASDWYRLQDLPVDMGTGRALALQSFLLSF